MSTVLAKLHERADAELERQAREELTEKLREGKEVGGCNLRDLIDGEWNGERERILVTDFESLLLMSSGRDYKADQIRDGLIERWLSTPRCQDIIQELMTTIEEDREV